MAHIDFRSPKKLVFFDLETTGLNTSTCELLTIAAWSAEKGEFVRYALPSGAIPPKASEINGFTKVGNRLLLRGTPVESVPEATAVLGFIDYLKSHGETVVLVAHNLKYDLSVICSAALRAGLHEDFARAVEGGVCSLQMSRAADWEDGSPPNHKLGTLVSHLFGTAFSFQAHDGREDVKALMKVFDHLAERCDPEEFSETIENFVDRMRIPFDLW